MFTSKVQAIYDQQRQRLKVTLEISNEDIDAIFEDLYARGHSPEIISQKCCAELKNVLKKRYDEPIGSNRLSGYGWTTTHVEDHMHRFLHGLLQEAAACLKVTLKDVADLDS